MSGRQSLLFAINTNLDFLSFDETINEQYNDEISFGNVYRSIIILTEILDATKIFTCIRNHSSNVMYDP